MDTFIHINVQEVDITELDADVVALKYAGGLAGAAGAVARALGKSEIDFKKSLPIRGNMELFPAANRMKPKQALFLRVVSLSHFDFQEIYLFSRDVLKGLARMAPETRHLGLTLHGTGFGLDTRRVFKSELDGCINAIVSGEHPPRLERITIVDRNRVVVKQCQAYLAELLPAKKVKSSLKIEPEIKLDKDLPDEFDVFISYKSEDIGHARKVYDHLISNQYRVFFSKESLPRMGSAEYHEQIDLAIEKARHLVVVTSKREYATSKWVEYEWRLFLGEKLAGRKSGNLISVISGDMGIKDLPISLRNREVIPLNPEGLNNLLGFITKIDER